MNCKYCHMSTHYIDDCPTIICKNCKDIGHPQWLCKNSKNLNSNINQYNKNKNSDNKYNLLVEQIKKKSNNENINYKNIAFYSKLGNIEWGNLVSE